MISSGVDLNQEISKAKSILDSGVKLIKEAQDGSPRPIIFNKLVQFVWTSGRKFNGQQGITTNQDIVKSREVIPSYYAVFFSDKYVYVIFEEGMGYRFNVAKLTSVEHLHIKNHGEPVTLKFAKEMLQAEDLRDLVTWSPASDKPTEANNSSKEQGRAKEELGATEKTAEPVRERTPPKPRSMNRKRPPKDTDTVKETQSPDSQDGEVNKGKEVEANGQEAKQGRETRQPERRKEPPKKESETEMELVVEEMDED